jgi:tRNA (5-methylaminomethyl-2-thiouridylate)-methyltransferase
MKIAVLVSGGVDSSVVLALLKAQGHEVVAFYLKIWLEDELAFLGECPWEEDLAYVQKLCQKLDVPLQILSMQQEYHDKVVQYTIAEIKAGRTPNPDIFCNSWIKFGAFYDAIKTHFASDNFDKVATGHYAQVAPQGEQFILKLTPDQVKDQTYFLARLGQSQLAKALFPIGHLVKSQVRDLAHQFDLPTKNRKDSQGICFLGKLKFSEFVKYHLGERPGDLIEYETGQVLGRHLGFWFYTIGQRQGLGLSGGPWYVVGKELAKNIVYISKAYFDETKERDTFEVTNCHWISESEPQTDNLQVKIRHGAQRYNCIVQKIAQDRWLVKLAGRDQGIATGQYAVFYEGEVCLGAAMISEVR